MAGLCAGLWRAAGHTRWKRGGTAMRSASAAASKASSACSREPGMVERSRLSPCTSSTSDSRRCTVAVAPPSDSAQAIALRRLSTAERKSQERT